MNRWKNIKSNLWRNQDSGVYYARIDAPNGVIWRSLKTNLRTVADLRLGAKLAQMRAGSGNVRGDKLTLAELAAVYMDRKRERGYRRKNQLAFKPLRARSLDYRQETVNSLKACWTGFDDIPIVAVNDAQCHLVADILRRKYSATRFNGIIQTMRGMFEIAVELGVCDKNPAATVAFAAVKPSDKPIPTREQVTEIWRLLDSVPARKFSRLSVRAMAFTGLRPNEARHLSKDDINLSAGTLTARETKNGKPRTIQLIPQAVELFNDEGVAKILMALKKNPRRALRTISKKVGIELTPYTMRHLHMSVLVESGIDIATAALISGHQDRGVTLLRHYVHARSDHVRRQLSKIVI